MSTHAQLEEKKFRGNWTPNVPIVPSDGSQFQGLRVAQPTTRENVSKSIASSNPPSVTSVAPVDSNRPSLTKGYKHSVGGHYINHLSTPFIQYIYEGELQRAYEYVIQHEDAIHDRDTNCDFPVFALAAGVSDTLSFIQLMLRNGVLVDICCTHGNTALRESCLANNYEIAKFLLSKGANVNQQNANGETALYVACQRGTLQLTKLLASKGAKFGILTFSGASNLTSAVSFNQLEIAEWLLQNGENIDHANSKGATPLIIAVQKGYTDMVNLLLSYYASPVKAMKGGFSPLYNAVQFNRVDIAEILIEGGAVVDQLTDKGFTPLFYAAQKGYVDLVKLLLHYGADVNLKYKGKGSVMHYAKKGGNQEVIDCLSVHSDNPTHISRLKNNLPVGWSKVQAANSEHYVDNINNTVHSTIPE